VRKRKKIGPSKQVAELALKDVELRIAKGEYFGIYEEKKLTFRQFARSISPTPRQTKAIPRFVGIR
jgi:hypothetical protein